MTLASAVRLVSLLLLSSGLAACRRAPRRIEPDPDLVPKVAAVPSTLIAPVVDPAPPVAEATPGSRSKPTPDPPVGAPARCRVLVNFSVEWKPGLDNAYFVADVRFGDDVRAQIGPGIVMKDDEGLISLQLLRFEEDERKGGRVVVHRGWDTLLGRRLPDGEPTVWLNREPEVVDADSPGMQQIDSLELTAVLGRFVSMYGHSSTYIGAVYFGDEWPDFTLSAPDGRRVSLVEAVGDEAAATFRESLRTPPGGSSPEERLGKEDQGFSLRFDGLGDDAFVGLGLGASGPFSAPGGWSSLSPVPAPLHRLVEFSQAHPSMLGQPGSCGFVGLVDGRLQAQRRGEAVTTRLPVPAGLRVASLLGIVWLPLDDGFRLSSLAASGRSARRAAGKFAPTVQHRLGKP